MTSPRLQKSRLRAASHQDQHFDREDRQVCVCIVCVLMNADVFFVGNCVRDLKAMSASPAAKKTRVSANDSDAGEEPTVFMVTGGTGLVGKALEDLVTSKPNPNERWIFLSSADGDLW